MPMLKSLNSKIVTKQNQSPIKASFLDSVCLKYNADAVISLEFFNSYVPNRALIIK